MSQVLLDTHTWAWSFTAQQRLSAPAVAAIEAADTVSISATSFYEIGQKVRLGKWPEMAPNVMALVDIAVRQGVRTLDITPAVGLMAAVLDWAHRDPFDRIIGATALTEGLVLISADAVFDDLSSKPAWSGRVW